MTTLADLQLRLAYRLGEDSVPNNTNEKNRRKSFINEAYRSIMSKHTWWFAEKADTFNSVADQESYGTTDGVPSDVRRIIELRYDDVIYNEITQVEAMQVYQKPYNTRIQSYFLFGGKIYPVPAFTTSGTDNISIKYYATATTLSSDSDTPLIPDMYVDALVAYAYSRVCLYDDERGTAADGFDEYGEILKDMTAENNKYLFAMKDSVGNEELSTIFY